MIPGVGKAIRDVDIDDNAFKGIEAIIQSMTPKRKNQSGDSQYQPPSAHCQGLWHQLSGGEQAHQAVRPDPEDDEDGHRQQNGWYDVENEVE